MILYHVTTPRKMARYHQHRVPQVLPPVRGFSTAAAARHWAKQTGRTIVIELDCPDDATYKLPDHHNRFGCAHWCERAVKVGAEVAA